MSKQIFRVGDKVFDIRYGWGKVIKNRERETYICYPIEVQFDKDGLQEDIVYTSCGKYHKNDAVNMLSFTEYTLEGFDQKRPINYENYMRKWGKFWNGASDNIFIDVLDDLCEDCDGNVKFVPYEIDSHYDHFEPLSEEQLKVLGLKNS